MVVGNREDRKINFFKHNLASILMHLVLNNCLLDDWISEPLRLWAKSTDGSGPLGSSSSTSLCLHVNLKLILIIKQPEINSWSMGKGSAIHFLPVILI